MAQLIDGKLVSQSVKDRIKEEVAALKADGKEITLAVIIVGDDPASRVYVNNKKKACEYVGFRSLEYALPAETTQEELIALIEELNARDDVLFRSISTIRRSSPRSPSKRTLTLFPLIMSARS